MNLDPGWIKARFIECAIAWGYCQAIGKADRSEPFRVDLEGLEKAFREFCPTAQAEMTELMIAHDSPWVQFAAAAFVSRTEPLAALPVLRELSGQDGMWGPISLLAVRHLEQRH